MMKTDVSFKNILVTQVYQRNDDIYIYIYNFSNCKIFWFEDKKYLKNPMYLPYKCILLIVIKYTEFQQRSIYEKYIIKVFFSRKTTCSYFSTYKHLFIFVSNNQGDLLFNSL